jgi:uncharacterized repeat protein (TIGR01451 family)
MLKQKSKKINFFKLLSRSSKSGIFYVCSFMVLAIVISLGLFLSNTNKNTASAASIAYANGQVSLSKKYFQNNIEVSSLSATPNTEVTVRVKYDNTGDQAALNSFITDSVPNDFNYVSGSLKNCYVDLTCVTLSDSLVSTTTTPGCPSGYTLNGNQCEQRVAATGTTFGCPSGYSDIGGNPPCVRYSNLINTCPSGYTVGTSQCEIRAGLISSTTYSCPAGWSLIGSNCQRSNRSVLGTTRGGGVLPVPLADTCPLGGSNFNTSTVLNMGVVSPGTPGGYAVYDCWDSSYYGEVTVFGDTNPTTSCFGVTVNNVVVNNFVSLYSFLNELGYYTHYCVSPNVNQNVKIVSGACPSNYTFNSDTGSTGNSICIKTLIPGTPNTTPTTNCPPGYTNVGGTLPCINYTPFTGSSCPSGYTLNGSQCEQKTAKVTSNTCPSGFTDNGGSPPCFASTAAATNTGSIALAPTTGYFGTPPNATGPQDLEAGKKHYLQFVECFESSANTTVNTFNIDSVGRSTNTSATNAPTLIPSCASTQTVGFSYVQTVILTGNKYLHLVECYETLPGSDINTFNINSSNRTSNIATSNTSALTPSCISNQTINSSNIRTLQTFENRYLHIVECFESTTLGDINTFNIDSQNHTANSAANNNPTLVPECTSTNNNIIQSAVQTFDLLDTTRGYGYIEYKIKSLPTAVGLYGTNVSMTGNFGTVTAGAEKTIDIIGCGSRNPSNWQINLTLGDAELRSDQDFTCNFTPKICPVVFNDLDNDGIQSANETNVAGQTISLYREDGTTLVTTIVTNTSGNVCFDSVAGGGAVYKVTNPNPITPYNTTGGNIKTVSIGSNDAVTTVKYGYSSGTLSLSVPLSVSFPSSTTSQYLQTICTDINPIQVTDTRGDQPGWSVTGVVDNFANSGNTKTLNIANKFSSAPGALTIVSGLSGPQVGINKTVASTTDPFTVMSAGAGQGKGVYRLNQSVCQILEPYTISADYQTIITYTII